MDFKLMHLIFHELFAFTEKMTDRPGSAFYGTHCTLLNANISSGGQLGNKHARSFVVVIGPVNMQLISSELVQVYIRYASGYLALIALWRRTREGLRPCVLLNS